jgi:RNase adapter protein RapZ
MQLIVVTGLSGSGKSVALGVLEDSGFYCVDNLPARLVPELIQQLRDAGIERAAVSIDARTIAAAQLAGQLAGQVAGQSAASLAGTANPTRHATPDLAHGTDSEELPSILASLKAQGVDLRMLFLNASTETLIQRYSETRRRHPLAHLGGGTGSANENASKSANELTVAECVARERELLAPLDALAHHIDTTGVRPNTLRGWIKDFLQSAGARRGSLTLVFTSFGFKHGIPSEADLVYDVRMLPNPYYDPALRALTGKDAPVIHFLDAVPEVKGMFDDIRNFLKRWIPAFERDNRNYVTVALGCTGGQHRSVYLAEKLAATFGGQFTVLVRHRELRG